MPMGVLVETIYGNSSKTMLLPGNVTALVPTQPLAMTMLDSLTIHAKMRYVDSGSLYLSVTPKFYTEVLHQTLNSTAELWCKTLFRFGLKSIWCYTKFKL